MGAPADLPFSVRSGLHWSSERISRKTEKLRSPPPAHTRTCIRAGTSSIDTTCTVWDLERGIVDTQLIAHDREARNTQHAPATAP